jgi:cytochrome oxidase Cu insertion factor (SCO1/SenC/PrrC family)
MSTRTFVILIALLTTVLLGSVGAGYYVMRSMTTSDTGALVGGDFTLTDQTGARVSRDDFAGSYRLIYFGYTYCPDFCPTALTVMSQALDELGPELSEKVRPIFITIDPERDTVEALARYHEHFHPSFTMLTGTPEEVAVAAKAWRIYYRKAESESSSEYLMDHSTLTYLMGPDGRFLDHFPHDATAGDLAAALRKHLS